MTLADWHLELLAAAQEMERLVPRTTEYGKPRTTPRWRTALVAVRALTPKDPNHE